MAGKSKVYEIYQAEFVTSAVARRGFPKRVLPQVAFAGRSNSGKSSLMNALVRRKGLAKTSGSPGHTRLLNFFLINDRCFFVDLPGYGFAKASNKEQEKWRSMIEEYLVDNRDLRLVVMLLDARRVPSDQDDQLVEFLSYHGVPFLLVLTKSDKLKRAGLLKARRAIADHYNLDPEELVATSSVSGMGRDDLLKVIYDACQTVV